MDRRGLEEWWPLCLLVFPDLAVDARVVERLETVQLDGGILAPLSPLSGAPPFPVELLAPDKGGKEGVDDEGPAAVAPEATTPLPTEDVGGGLLLEAAVPADCGGGGSSASEEGGEAELVGGRWGSVGGWVTETTPTIWRWSRYEKIPAASCNGWECLVRP